MNILKSIGLETKGPYCFYRLGTDSAILVGIKRPRKGSVIIPERIGKLTVRGTDYPFCEGPIQEALFALSLKDLEIAKAKLQQYIMVAKMSLKHLPATVEYIAHGTDFDAKCDDIIPSNIRYIKELTVSRHEPITLPNSVRYLGRVIGKEVFAIHFSGDVSYSPAHHSLSEYLGREVEDIPQIGAGAFLSCDRLHELILGDHFVKIGANAMPLAKVPEGSFLPKYYRIHIPKSLEDVEENAFCDAEIETLIYPDDISDALRKKKLDIHRIEHLIIRDIGELESYTALVSKGLDSENHPEKCLYHLIRSASRIYFSSSLTDIFDGMFANSPYLSGISVGSEKTNYYLHGFIIPENIRRVGNDAFSKCYALKSINFPNGLQKIGDRACYTCDLHKLDLPESLLHIGDKAFACCQNLYTFNIPASLKHISADAFENCKKLRITTNILQQSSVFPEFHTSLTKQWSDQVNSHIDAGDVHLSKGPITIASKQAAYEEYRTALDLDPHCIKALKKIEKLLITPQVPHGIAACELKDLRVFLQTKESTDLVTSLDDTLEMIDSMSEILVNSGDIQSVWSSYCLNTSQKAAIELMRFLFDCIDKHPNTSGAVLYRMQIFLGSIPYSPTRNQTPETKKEFKLLCDKVSDYCNWSNVCLPPTEKFLEISKLTPAKMLEEIHRAIQGTDVEKAYYDAEFWLDMALKFDPQLEIPKEFNDLKNKFNWEKANKKNEPLEVVNMNFSTLFPASGVSTPSVTVPDYSKPTESEWTMSEAESEYWHSIVNSNSDGYSAIDLENEWSDLNDIGFWDDKSWQ